MTHDTADCELCGGAVHVRNPVSLGNINLLSRDIHVGIVQTTILLKGHHTSFVPSNIRIEEHARAPMHRHVCMNRIYTDASSSGDLDDG